MKVFVFHPQLQAFTYSPEYKNLAILLELGWEARAWMGRLFAMDNDFGEHWLDSDEFVEDIRDAAEALGLDPDVVVLMRVDPRRMVDGSDGPCNSDEFRQRFWNEVMASLDLSPELVYQMARDFHGRCSSPEKCDEIERRFVAWVQSQSGAVDG
jgi:hypothetical protein